MERERLTNDEAGEAFTPLTLNPAPFSGDEDQVLTCIECKAAYTMREYRVFAWVAHSDRCVTCGSAYLMAKIRAAIAEDLP